ncbi:hypothetical protein G6O69_28085 [Pseudenhygromyxa sp. WMMC2535]|uniref:hypothetical protein n=1 Tax=Pseudenhygromyxa sp. WMMC2535 TaxID=2712867 RepID=UPI001556040A|nr:hypothetical protein [Pseudenhygromyxa sp. WMMC2535]NVB41726.1 hypothetical protein [Pseudenhygromyxa sp. WMMC2535]
MPKPLHAGLVACCGLSPLLGSCEAAEATPPTLEDAYFEDTSTLLLRFSEPIGPVADVDPASHFRLGAGLVVDYQGETLSVYYDVSHHFPEGLPAQDALISQRLPRHVDTTVAAIERGEGEDELRLILSYPVEADLCAGLAEAAALDIPAAIHLHYSEGQSPRVVDLAGNALADIGAWWVTDDFAAARPGVFPELDPRIDIPCPQ